MKQQIDLIECMHKGLKKQTIDSEPFLSAFKKEKAKRNKSKKFVEHLEASLSSSEIK